ncbi:MAG: FprA family A-type flavoprotein [Phycisphaerae bacterium]|nr:FprA family A-type flavoprotein [Phycisphaerae bacterium]
MKSTEIKPGIYWVGYIDWDVRDFHGYQTSRGSTYNAYLIVDEKIALIDAVKGGYAYDLIDKISEHIDPAKIDYVVSNHTEPDHSGELQRILDIAKNAKVVATQKGKDGLEKYYEGNWDYEVVKTGDSISLGKNTMEFIATPMLHWPDSMFTYIPEQKLLFSMDAFGQHFASSGRFDDQVDICELLAEAKIYYANIIMHLGSTVARTLKAAEKLEIDMIAPSHGVIWRSMIADIISAYQDWAVCKPTNKALVLYDSMWHSTEMMAVSIAEGLGNGGVPAKLLNVSINDVTHLATEVLDCAAVIVGSPTLNNGMLPTVASFMTYIQGLQPKGKLGFAFGSHGWAGGAVPKVRTMLEDTGVEIVHENITCKYKPDAEELKVCYEAGQILAEKIKTNICLP